MTTKKPSKETENQDVPETNEEVQNNAPIEAEDIHIAMIDAENYVEAINKLNAPAVITLADGDVISIPPKGVSRRFKKSDMVSLSNFSNLIYREVK